MFTIAFMLLCLTGIGHGRRVQGAATQLQRNLRAESQRLMEPMNQLALGSQWLPKVSLSEGVTGVLDARKVLYILILARSTAAFGSSLPTALPSRVQRIPSFPAVAGCQVADAHVRCCGHERRHDHLGKVPACSELELKAHSAWTRHLRVPSPMLELQVPPPAVLQAITFPCLTLVAAVIGLLCPVACAPLGTVVVFQWGLSVLMLSMGLSLKPADLRRAALSPREVALNAILCFGIMPLAALLLAKMLQLPSATAAGLVLLGSVSGGQASNLCTLLAGGDLALSVVLTVSTTLLGVVATPTLVQLLLGTSVTSDAAAVLQSIAKLVLLPLTSGLVIGQQFPNLVEYIRPSLPRLGIAALLVLVTGGSANTAALLCGTTIAWKAHVASVLLPLLGGSVALAAARLGRFEEAVVRTLTIETMIKSPVLAFVLARKHFAEAGVAVAPAASMVWLATIGAALASVWSRSGSNSQEGARK